MQVCHIFGSNVQFSVLQKKKHMCPLVMCKLYIESIPVQIGMSMQYCKITPTVSIINICVYKD